MSEARSWSPNSTVSSPSPSIDCYCEGHVVRLAGYTDGEYDKNIGLYIKSQNHPTDHKYLATEQLLWFVTEGCAHWRQQRSKRWGHQDCVDQSQRGVEMRFYPATDPEDSEPGERKSQWRYRSPGNHQGRMK
ncbi:hypothetical protein VZT92_007357 [Zoarces viviparus]|uniref:Uncharacterized protein n=1 Tax=Zoarces viviparus TaxID=48416 RepID=A0AAW1FJC6_ZOAVI